MLVRESNFVASDISRLDAFKEALLNLVVINDEKFQKKENTLTMVI